MRSVHAGCFWPGSSSARGEQWHDDRSGPRREDAGTSEEAGGQPRGDGELAAHDQPDTANDVYREQGTRREQRAPSLKEHEHAGGQVAEAEGGSESSKRERVCSTQPQELVPEPSADLRDAEDHHQHRRCNEDPLALDHRSIGCVQGCDHRRFFARRRRSCRAVAIEMTLPTAARISSCCAVE